MVACLLYSNMSSRFPFLAKTGFFEGKIELNPSVFDVFHLKSGSNPSVYAIFRLSFVKGALC